MVYPQAPQGNDPAPPLERSVSTKRFLKILRKFTGHDLKAFADRWVFGKGCPNLSCGFFFNKKKHVLEFAVKQNKSPAGRIIVWTFYVESNVPGLANSSCKWTWGSLWSHCRLWWRSSYVRVSLPFACSVSLSFHRNFSVRQSNSYIINCSLLNVWMQYSYFELCRVS